LLNLESLDSFTKAIGFALDPAWTLEALITHVE